MLRNKISTEFNEFESVVILLELDDSEERKINDIRDPAVIRFIFELQQDLSNDPLISNVQSDQVDISWTPGNGSRRLVVMREANPVSRTPVDGIDYPDGGNVFGAGGNLAGLFHPRQ